MKEKRFNYVVGHYWKEQPDFIGVYSYFGDVQTSTVKQSEEFLAYVKEKSPEHD